MTLEGSQPLHHVQCWDPPSCGPPASLPFPLTLDAPPPYTAGSSEELTWLLHGRVLECLHPHSHYTWQLLHGDPHSCPAATSLNEADKITIWPHDQELRKPNYPVRWVTVTTTSKAACQRCNVCFKLENSRRESRSVPGYLEEPLQFHDQSGQVSSGQDQWHWLCTTFMTID
jgi:hypothetical protein